MEIKKINQNLCKLCVECHRDQSLGQKLFPLYINDICNISTDGIYILFADDTNILCANNNRKKLCKTTNQNLKELQIWFIVNKLSLSTEKKTTWYSQKNR